MDIILIISAAILGLIAFFEPCTIATHTLFASRAHQKNQSERIKDLIELLLSRALLVVLLLTLAVSLVSHRPQWSSGTAGMLLILVATLYVVSRFMYIPIPHIKFYRFLPKRLKAKQSIQLGFTFPACTIPLFVVLAASVIWRQSIGLAMIMGSLYALMFTLPTAVTAFRGVSESTGRQLGRVARLTPYLTALLFITAAFFLIMPESDLNRETVTGLLQKPSFVGIAIGFITGLMFSFNPVSFVSIPVTLAYVTKAGDKKRAMMMGIAFVLGMILIHVVLGVLASLGAEWIKSIMGRFWGMVLGPVLVLLGFLWAGWINIRLPWFGFQGRSVSSLAGAFMLGIPFSIAVCPFCSPALIVMLTASAAIGSLPFGFFLLLAFAVGRGIPILLGTWSMGWLETLKGYVRYQRTFEMVGGITLILSGLYLLNEYFFIIVF